MCVVLSEGQLDGITATVALSTSDDTATTESIIELIFQTQYNYSLPQLTIHH